MAVMDKPALDEALLVHYGIRGMKWGTRKGQKKTGVTRTRGALIDRNDRTIMRIKEAQQGKGRIFNRVRMGVGRAVLGDARAKRWTNTAVKNLTAQNARLKSGNAKALDVIRAGLMATPVDMLVSVRPK